MTRLFALTIFFACIFSASYSKTLANFDSKNFMEINDNFLKSNPITIEYSNPVNGYKVSAIWLLENFSETSGDGPAILSFTNIKTKVITYVTQHHFSEKINNTNLKYLKFKGVGDKKVFIGNESFLQISKYILPKVVPDEFTKHEGFGAYIPFFFKDVDFDKKEELILVDCRFSEKGGYSNQVYKMDGDSYEWTVEPFNNFNNFYMNTEREGANYNRTYIDYKNKSIKQSYISGAATGGETIYTYNPETSSVELVSKSTTEWDEKSNGGTITTMTDKNGKVIKVSKSGQ